MNWDLRIGKHKFPVQLLLQLYLYCTNTALKNDTVLGKITHNLSQTTRVISFSRLCHEIVDKGIVGNIDSMSVTHPRVVYSKYCIHLKNPRIYLSDSFSSIRQTKLCIGQWWNRKMEKWCAFFLRKLGWTWSEEYVAGWERPLKIDWTQLLLFAQFLRLTLCLTNGLLRHRSQTLKTAQFFFEIRIILQWKNIWSNPIFNLNKLQIYFFSSSI